MVPTEENNYEKVPEGWKTEQVHPDPIKPCPSVSFGEASLGPTSFMVAMEGPNEEKLAEGCMS
jgi:hypothetical protein